MFLGFLFWVLTCLDGFPAASTIPPGCLLASPPRGNRRSKETHTCIIRDNHPFTMHHYKTDDNIYLVLFISIAKRCSYNSPAQRSNPIPSTYSSRAKNGQTEQDQNAGVRLTMQNWDIRNNLFRQNFCRSLRKFRNCIKKTLQNISIKY